MIRKIAILFLLTALAACAASHSPTHHCPREGGIGGTGACAIQADAT